MLKFNAVNKNEIKQRIVEHMGPSVSGPSVSRPSVSGPSVSRPSVSGPSVSRPSVSGPSASGPSVSRPSVSSPSVSVVNASECNASTAVLSSDSICIPTANTWTTTNVKSFAAGAKCVNGSTPNIMTVRNDGREYKCY